MEKVIIILDGVSAGKTLFIETIKSKGWWTWNINSNNVLTMLAHKVGWNGVRDKNYYDFMNDLRSISNKYFDFERKNLLSMITKFFESDKVQVLVLHRVDTELSRELIETYTECYTILINDNDVVDDTYCKTLNSQSENYVNEVLSVMNTLTKSFKENN